MFPPFHSTVLARVLLVVTLGAVTAACAPGHRREASPALAAFCVRCACEPDADELSIIVPLPAQGSSHAPSQPPPHVPVPPAAADPFFAGVSDLVALLPQADAAAGIVGTPRSVDLEALAAKSVAALRRRFERVERRDVGAFYVHVAGYHAAASPTQCADVLVDVAAEKAALDADEAADLGDRTVQGDRARRMSLAMLGMGEGPFKWDFRWEFEGVRRDRPDGSVLLRYAIVDGPGNERVSVFSGVATLVPAPGGGTTVREVLAIGSTVSPPFFLKGKARSEVAKVLTRRVERLAARLNAR